MKIIRLKELKLHIQNIQHREKKEQLHRKKN